MDLYIDFVFWCKQNLHLYDEENLTKEYSYEEVPHSDFEIHLVMFLLKLNRPQTKTVRNPFNNMMLDLTFDECSGRVFQNLLTFRSKPIVLYLGRFNNKCYFFQENVLFYCSGLDIEYIQNKKYDFVIRHDVYVPPKKIDLKIALHDIQKERTPRKKKIARVMDQISDCQIQCKDGMVKANRWHLCLMNDFFFSYMTKYNESSGVYSLLDFECEVFKQYIQFGLDKDSVNKQVIYNYPNESLKLGMFLQDYKFVKFIYDLIAPECDEESLSYLNDEIKEFFRFNDLSYHSKNNMCRTSKMLF